ncbi:MAG: hypothetical protein GXO73_05060 [Calditrichaeota bacterium]|nr:hypothetical protein [Calditrichota bacterium]
MSECAEVQRQISALYDGELGSAESQRVLAHMATCEDCRKFSDSLELLRDQVASAIGRIDTASLDEAFFQNLAKERMSRTSWWRTRISVPLPVLGASILVLLLALVLALRPTQQQPQTPAKAPSKIRTVVLGPQDIVKQEIRSPL